jgi:pimeloyl-ACP methyl ester carboxylesterase
VQISNQVAILRKLTSLIKDGKYTNGIGKPKKVVLVGHSLGSAISSTAAALEPSISDGLVLTGMNMDSRTDCQQR